jgi:hypothetical protein
VLAKYPTTKRLTLSDGTTAVLPRANGRASAVAAVDLLAALGPTLASIIGGGGLKISETESIPLSTVLADFSAIVAAETARAAAKDSGVPIPADLEARGDKAMADMTAIVGGLLRAAKGLDGSRLLHLADFLVLGRLELGPPGAQALTLVSDPDTYDALVQNPRDVIAIAQAAAVLSLGPIFAAGGGNPQPAKG